MAAERILGLGFATVARPSHDAAEIRSWFDDYLRAFAACGRGDSDDVRALLEYYGVPLFFTTDEGAVALTSEDEVLGAARRQVEGLRAADYDRSELLDDETTVLNATTAIHTAAFSRVRGDGSEIGRLRATYFITDGREGRRISAVAVRAL
jgi:hypothetical protein